MVKLVSGKKRKISKKTPAVWGGENPGGVWGWVGGARVGGWRQRERGLRKLLSQIGLC